MRFLTILGVHEDVRESLPEFIVPTLRPPRRAPRAIIAARFHRVLTAALLLSGCLQGADEHPALGEVCNGLDDDLDGRTDEAGSRLCPFTVEMSYATAACTPDDPPDGGVGLPCRIATCDEGHHDLDGRFGNGCEYACRVAHGGVERCNGRDDDCDGITDEAPTGAPRATQQQGVCQDALQICSSGMWVDPPYAERPGYEAVEVSCDDLDNDCDGAVDEGYPLAGADCAVGVGACAVSAEYVCTPEGDGVVCPAVAGVASDELCNGVDDDCDGTPDEDQASTPCVSDLPGRCVLGHTTCDGGVSRCAPDTPALEAELCNGEDDDCDGTIDEDADGACPGFAINADSGLVECIAAACQIRACNGDRWDVDGLYANGCEYACTVNGDGVERCNDIDDDCDGTTDEGLEPPPADLQFGVCAGATRVCADRWVEPAYGGIAGYEHGREASCDGLDNDCDGRTDEEWQGVPDGQCDGLDDDCDGRVDEDRACAETVCAAGTLLPPCNGCPEGTVVPTIGPLGGAWVCVPAGEFLLGSPDDEEGRFLDEGPQVPMAITRPLLVQTHEVTQVQWQTAFDNAPSVYLDCGPACPVESINWFEAVAFVNHLSVEAGLEPCYALSDCVRAPGADLECDLAVARAPADCTGYRLPTEAEWEYIARGATQTRFWSGEAEEDLARVGWYFANSGGLTHPVCSLPVEALHHPWGLCDVHGNVWEWTESWYRPYPEPPADGARLADPVDPAGPPNGAGRIKRSGSLINDARVVRTANRGWQFPGAREGGTGFRPVRFAGPPPRAR